MEWVGGREGGRGRLGAEREVGKRNGSEERRGLKTPCDAEQHKEVEEGKALNSCPEIIQHM